MAPGPPENRVSPVKTTPRSGHREADRAGRVAGRVQHVHLRARDLEHLAVAQVAVGLVPAVHEVPQHAVVGVQQHRGADPLGELGRAADVVVVGVGAGDGDDGAVADGRGDGVGVVRRVEDEHLVVVAEQPDVVVDVERLPVEAEGARQ